MGIALPHRIYSTKKAVLLLISAGDRVVRRPVCIAKHDDA